MLVFLWLENHEVSQLWLLVVIGQLECVVILLFKFLKLHGEKEGGAFLELRDEVYLAVESLDYKSANDKA